MLAHTCAKHGLNCPTSTPYYPVVTKTPEQIRQEREKKDLQEAAEDANDHGVEAYERKDWQTAVNYFRIALEYDPGFEDADYNLKKARQKLEEERRLSEERKKAEEQSIRVVKLNEKIQQYMTEADHITVPPPAWESMIQAQVEQLKIGSDQKHLWLAQDVCMAAFDEVTKVNKATTITFKVLLIGGKSFLSYMVIA
jgi:hypothetical protein